jgi:hypothetical protein
MSANVSSTHEEDVSAHAGARTLVLLGEASAVTKLHCSPRRTQLLQGDSSLHLTRRLLQRVQPFRDFFVPSCVILAAILDAPPLFLPRGIS